MAKRGTPEFYREEVARLTLLALDATEPGIRLQMLEMAATFKKLAELTERSNAIQYPQQKRETA